MENKVLLNGKIIDLFKAKERFHRKMTRLPITEKMKILDRFNKFISSLKRKKG